MKYLRLFGCVGLIADFLVVLIILSVFRDFSPIITALIIVLLQILLILCEKRVVIMLIQSVLSSLDGEEERISEESVKITKDSYGQEIKKIIDEYVAGEVQKANAEILQRKSEYSALQSQINPHFLYNTLETIRGQAIVDGNMEIAKMVETLASFFRYSISRKGTVVTLRDELNNIQDYMSIMQYRFGERFSLEIDIDEDDTKVYDYYVPRLIFQPIVENAILHGLDEKMEGGIVTIEVMVSDELIIMISDNGKGMSLKQLDDLNAKIHSENKYISDDTSAEGKGTGIALPNVNKRIKLLYGDKYGLNVYSSEACGTDVEIIIPIVDKMENAAVE
jgi:two-component system sensor histidine kinase YesM